MSATMNPNSVVSATRLQFAMAQSQAFRLMESQWPAQTPDDLATPEIPETTGKVATAGIKYLSGLVKQLYELRQQDQFDDCGTSRLDESVFTEAHHLMVNTAISLMINHAAKMPHGCASTDDEGGLRVEWFRDDASVHLVIPAPNSTVKPYIFHNIGATSAIDRIVSGDVLARWLSQIGD